MTLVETLIDHNYRHKVQLSKEKLQPVVSTITAETKYEERDSERNANNVNMYTFIQYPVTANKPRKKEANFFGHAGRSDERI